MISKVTCYISLYPTISDVAIQRIALGSMAANQNLQTFQSLELLAPLHEMNRLGGQTTVQFSVDTLSGIPKGLRPSVFIEFTRDIAAFVKCSVAGAEILTPKTEKAPDGRLFYEPASGS